MTEEAAIALLCANTLLTSRAEKVQPTNHTTASATTTTEEDSHTIASKGNSIFLLHDSTTARLFFSSMVMTIPYSRKFSPGKNFRLLRQGAKI